MKRLVVPFALLVIAVIVASRLSPHFLDFRYLLDSSTIYVEAGLLALAMTFVIISGNIDLSVGSNVVLSGCLFAKMLAANWPVALAIPATLITGILLGALNGLLITKLKLPSFLVTLGTMATYRGAAQAMLGPTSVKIPAGVKGLDQKLFAAIPVPLWIFIAMAALASVLLHRTVFGRRVFAVGSNESAARYSALPVEQTKVAVFALAGLMAGLGAILLDSRLGVARFDHAKGMELEAITMVVVGGTAITGGKGAIGGTVIALFLIQVIKSAMGVANVKAEYQLTAIGILLIAAVLLGRIRMARLPLLNRGEVKR